MCRSSAFEGEALKQDATVQKGRHRFSSNMTKSTNEETSSESTENLSKLILNKMRSKGTTVSRISVTSEKDGVKIDPHHSANVNATTATSTEDKSIQDSKWAQVMSSIRKIAVKNKAVAAVGKPNSSSGKESENIDDFADLDHPESGSDSSTFRNPNQTSVRDAIWLFFFSNLINETIS